MKILPGFAKRPDVARHMADPYILRSLLSPEDLVAAERNPNDHEDVEETYISSGSDFQSSSASESGGGDGVKQTASLTSSLACSPCLLVGCFVLFFFSLLTYAYA